MTCLIKIAQHTPKEHENESTLNAVRSAESWTGRDVARVDGGVPARAGVDGAAERLHRVAQHLDGARARGFERDAGLVAIAAQHDDRAPEERHGLDGGRHGHARWVAAHGDQRLAVVPRRGAERGELGVWVSLGDGWRGRGSEGK